MTSSLKAWFDKIYNLTKAVDSSNQQIAKLLEKQELLLRRIEYLENQFELKAKDDDKYKNKVDNINDQMNQMTGAFKQLNHMNNNQQLTQENNNK